jgi:hypothetical protein
MYAQLAVLDALDPQAHSLFCGHVSLHSQEVHNRHLFLRDACSIDLSDASDHVSCDVVRLMFPQLWPVLAKVRSTHTLFPDGEVVPLATFAPMGSGVCFIMMTLVILNACALAARNIRRLDPTLPLWYSVYGDDIICSVYLYSEILRILTGLGLVPNPSKSSQNMIYRESCGVELFRDSDITSIYIREDPVHLPAVAVESICQRLADRHFVATANHLANMAQAVRGIRYNRALQRQEVLVRANAVKQKLTQLHGWAGLNRWFAVRSLGSSPTDRLGQEGVASEVWTKSASRFKASEDYPFLTSHWLNANVRASGHDS